MTFVCRPDQAFAEKTKGPSGVDWRARFSQYKSIILCLPPACHSRLLAWYDERLFSRSTTSAVITMGAFESGSDEIDDLIQRLGDADVDSPLIPPALSFASLTPLAPFQYPSSTHPPASSSSQRIASLSSEGDAPMSEPDTPDVPKPSVETETVVRSKAKKATRVPRARRVQSARRGVNSR